MGGYILRATKATVASMILKKISLIIYVPSNSVIILFFEMVFKVIMKWLLSVMNISECLFNAMKI